MNQEFPPLGDWSVSFNSWERIGSINRNLGRLGQFQEKLPVWWAVSQGKDWVACQSRFR